MIPSLDFDLAIAYWSFGWLTSDELPIVALESIEQGRDSDSLRRLAAMDAREDPDSHILFEKTLSELGKARLAKPDAGRIIALDYARRICDGKLDPVEGARAIWRVSLECEELAIDWGIFGGRVTEYEGAPDSRELIRDTIISDARNALHL